MEASLTEFEEKGKEEIKKKLEAAEMNREKVIQSKLESLKKHVNNQFIFLIACIAITYFIVFFVIN